MPLENTSTSPGRIATTGAGITLAGARALNVLQGMALAWGFFLGVVILTGLGHASPSTLAGIDAVRSDPSVADAVRLADLPLGARLAAWIGTVAIFLAWSAVLGAAARVSRQVSAGEPFVPGVAAALRVAAWACGAAAVLVPGMWVATAAQVNRWASAAPSPWGEVGVHTSGVPFDTVAGLLVGAVVAAVLASAFGHGSRLRQETDGLV
ncbi:DUF2975 domain-containing protein [Ornithinimicrobium sp. LYQ92]|uniref:DUF2975 domain-containing protein n=1 Tax=Serinicoccus sp. LYQ92 TaxID=3378798 RepID=UPI0038555A26